jgi:hypothetical protein
MNKNKLKQISKELKKASAMHKAQANKIDKMLTGLKPKVKKNEKKVKRKAS